MKINSFIPDKGGYTQIIGTIANAPKRLWFVGDLPQQRAPTLAIVGSRKPTTYGKDITHRLTYDLASRGVVIVSGLALGIDSLAHRAALEAGGTTIAIMPCGLDRVYPASHRNLAADIIKNGGALISEYEPGAELYPKNFIGRNRIVSGISDGLLVVEASAKSGTMHTANFALEQGRSVMAIPGPITNPTSEGCHNLLKSGARLITSAQDILDELGLTDTAKQSALPFAATPQEQILLELLGKGIRDGDELQLKSRLRAAEFAQTLTMLEITGKIRPLGGNQWGIKH
jgi:DNA processing protein